jgi:hypothetical protein
LKAELHAVRGPDSIGRAGVGVENGPMAVREVEISGIKWKQVERLNTKGDRLKGV